MTEQEFTALVSIIQRAGMNAIEVAFVQSKMLEIREAMVEKPPEVEEKPMSDSPNYQT